MKRLFDILFALVGLFFLWPLFLVASILIKMDDNGPILFKQERIGRGFKPFFIYKFRTMVENASKLGSDLTVGSDSRITKVGLYLRMTKIDELPQLLNILKGDMSFVGPRPEVKSYVELFKKDYEKILKIRPGITDPASIRFRNEAEILSHNEDPEAYYLNVILPEKIRLTHEYIRKSSILYDLKLIFSTLFHVFYPVEAINRLLDKLMEHRFIVVVAVQAVLIILANYLAFYVRFEGAVPSSEVNLFLSTLPIVLICRFALFKPFGLYHGLWRYISLKEVENIVAAATIGSAALYFIIHGFIGFIHYPRSVLLLDWVFTIIFLVAIRMIKRIHNEQQGEEEKEKTVLLIGAKDGAEKVLRELLNNRNIHYDVIGIVDDDPYRMGKKIHNVPVLGTTLELEEIIKNEDPDDVLITIPSAPLDLLQHVVKVCQSLKKPVKVIPGLKDLLYGKVHLSLIRDIEPEELLFREPVDSNAAGLNQFYSGKSILVTGAGGTIGSVIANQVAAAGPSRLILFERHECSLYTVEMNLKNDYPGLDIVPVIADVTDRQRTLEVIKKNKPQVIFHAAANKHVPMMELNPSEAIKTNVLGTRIVADTAGECGVDTFLLISTDKAVDPVSVMGVSKRIAEFVVKGVSEVHPMTKYLAVRFGNVLGSSGSVVPLFKKQIKEGGPITVTHPDVTRYFMTQNEAVHLVLQAATMGKGGEVFVLDMDKPIKILDLAKTLIHLCGLVPGKDIEIVFTGMRPGERMHESLFNENENILSTSHPKIMMAINGISRPHILDDISFISTAVTRGDIAAVFSRINEMVPSYQPKFMSDEKFEDVVAGKEEKFVSTKSI